MASGKCIRGIEIDFFRKETNMLLQSGGNSSPSVKALVQESPVFSLILICFQVESNNPRPCSDTFHSSGV
jgi:hypothetical protein